MNYIILLILIKAMNSQEQLSDVSLEAANLDYDGIFGIGWGIFAIILSIIVGITCCIFGLATIHPIVFYIIGFLTPIVTFIFMISVPVEKIVLDETISQVTNPFVVVRWLYFSIMFVSIYLIFLPLCSLWRIMVIPQRVDSRAQREYHEKYEKFLSDERERLKKEKEIKDMKNKEMPLQNPNEYKDTGFNPDIILPVREDNQHNIEMGIFNNEEDKLKAVAENERRKKNLMNLRRRFLDKAKE